MKPLGEAEGGDDEDTAEQGKDRADTLDYVNDEVAAGAWPVGVIVARHGDRWCATAQDALAESNRVVEGLFIYRESTGGHGLRFGYW